MESLPLKELDFGLQKPTGPSSGVVASIVLIIIALSSVSFLFVLTQLSGFSGNQNCFKNHKNPNFVIKLSFLYHCVLLSRIN